MQDRRYPPHQEDWRGVLRSLGPPVFHFAPRDLARSVSFSCRSFNPRVITSWNRTTRPAIFEWSAGFTFSRKIAHPNQFSETRNIFREQHWVVQEYFVALIAEHVRFAFVPPTARAEYTLSLCAPSIAGTSEKPLSNKVMFRGTASALDCRTSICITGAVKLTSTNCTMLGHGSHFTSRRLFHKVAFVPHNNHFCPLFGTIAGAWQQRWTKTPAGDLSGSS